MRVICRDCGALGRIAKTNNYSIETASLYCECTDPECGARWVAMLSYKETLSLSLAKQKQQQDTTQITLGKLSELSPRLQAAISKELSENALKKK
ncbi:ogr/Delta-like zinc finger family protein [Aeromonas jandaei]|uniref:ogr/Delta-like zinc finger family protein n=1 Tax=Aeromonas jandaei TaxID=650 RepID=UPI003BA230D3